MQRNLLIIKQNLQIKQRDLERQINDRGELEVERLADPMDVSTAQSARDTAGANINRTTLMLREVKAALGRVEAGDYGICVDCDEDILEKRLNVVPWAARCIPCQEAKDNLDRDRGTPKRLRSIRPSNPENYTDRGGNDTFR